MGLLFVSSDSALMVEVGRLMEVPVEVLCDVDRESERDILSADMSPVLDSKEEGLVESSV